jgi:hypothetical protein
LEPLNKLYVLSEKKFYGWLVKKVEKLEESLEALGE